MISLVARTCFWASLYGYSLGSAHSDLYAARNLIKFPLLLFVTASVCGPGHWMIARLLTALSFTHVQRVVWMAFHDTSLLLASLAPVVLFQGLSLRATDDGHLGGYDGFLALNVAAVGLAGSLALLRQACELLRAHALPRRRAGLLVGCWLLLSLAVGGQAAFYMRPFFGFPATRGGSPPFFQGARPDVRGARNFYEIVWQVIQQPPLR